MSKKFLTLGFVLLVLAACAQKDELFIPAKPEGMSDDQYTKTVEILQKDQTTIESTKDVFPLEAYLEMGLYYQVLQDYDHSIESLKKVLVNQPTNFNALNNIAVAYESNGDLEKALENYAKLADAYPDHWEALSDTLRLFKTLDRVEDGQKVLEHFVSNYPKEKTEDFNKFVSQMYEMLKSK